MYAVGETGATGVCNDFTPTGSRLKTQKLRFRQSSAAGQLPTPPSFRALFLCRNVLTASGPHIIHHPPSVVPRVTPQPRRPPASPRRPSREVCPLPFPLSLDPPPVLSAMLQSQMAGYSAETLPENPPQNTLSALACRSEPSEAGSRMDAVGPPARALRSVTTCNGPCNGPRPQ